MRRLFGSGARGRRREEGIGLVLAMATVSVFSLLGLYLTLNATTELRISDNHETHAQALQAAHAGLGHARQLFVGIDSDDLLRGPDGTYNNSSDYLARARTYGFRNPFNWDLARSLDMSNPASALVGAADDGIFNTGKVSGANGTPLIPMHGIALTAPNPYASGVITTARYFAKVSDNNGEASEIAADPADNPFVDGDGITLVRSLGVSRTVREVASSGDVRANSVAIVEARFKASRQFLMDSPLVVQGVDVQPANSNMFNGNSFDVDGLGSNYGISTIDTDLSDAASPLQQIRNSLAANQYDNISGLGAAPSIIDISAAVGADPDKSKLLDANYLYDFVHRIAPGFAKNVYSGPLQINSSNSDTFDLGEYDYELPYNHPSQRPVSTIVQGDLELGSSGVSGGGLLIVTGALSGNGSLTYNGLILVIGAGSTDLRGVNASIHGGVYTANVTLVGGVPTFGISRISLGGNSDVVFDSEAINMAVSLIPPSQLGLREILSDMDP